MKRNMTEWLQGILDSAPTRAAMPITASPGMVLIDKPLSALFSDGRVQFDSMRALCERYPSLAVLTAMDLSVEAEAFGSPVRLSDSEAPTVLSHIVSDMDGIKALRVPSVGAGRTSQYLEATRLAAEQIEGKVVLAGMIGPFSLACRLFDMSKLMMVLRREPETAQALLEKCTAFLTEYARAFKEAGANGIVVAEPAAGLISPAFCQKFSSDYVKRIVDAVQDESFVVVLHNCGNTEVLVNAMLFTGSKALHFGNAVDMLAIIPQIPRDVVAFGNIDPVKVMKMGSVREVKVSTLELLEEMSKYPNFVLSTGCDVPPGIPLANLDAFYKTLDIYNMTQEIRHKWLFDS
jgi:uroporphyrinogen decarboxylase